MPLAVRAMAGKVWPDVQGSVYCRLCLLLYAFNHLTSSSCHKTNICKMKQLRTTTFLSILCYQLLFSQIRQQKPEISVKFDWPAWANDQNHKYLFLHIGKAAGTTVFCEVVNRADPTTERERRIFCPNHQHEKKWVTNQNKNETEGKEPWLYQQRYGTRLHMTKMQGVHYKGCNELNVFLVNLRNPMTRLMSAYDYEKQPENWWQHKAFPAFKQCYPNYVSLESLLLDLGQTNLTGSTGTPFKTSVVGEMNVTSSSFCRNLGIDFIKGRITTYPSHMTFNYQFYEEQYFDVVRRSSNSTLFKNHYHTLTVRKEYLEEDLENIEMLLRTGTTRTRTEGNTRIIGKKRITGSDGDDGTPTTMNSSGKHEQLSREALDIACRHLCKDIQSYKGFLYRSENLSQEMKEDSITDLKKYCPFESGEINYQCN